MSEKLLSIGKILNFHGTDGEVKVGYTKGSEHYFTEVDKMYAEKNSEKILLTPEKVRFHKNTAVVKFKEINSIDEVTEFKGTYLKIPESKIKELLEKDEFYIGDLVGLSAYDSDGNKLGEVSGVSPAGGQDILFIKDSKGKEHLVPFSKAIVTDVNIKEQKITVNNIEGLMQTE